MRPQVSVVMGVFNCAATLEESLESIISQTHTDWEMVVCDDGSSDDTREIARQFARRDPRIRVIVNDHNLGLARTLDRCISEARGTLLARQDGDDISEPIRLTRLLQTLEAHPNIAVVSSWMSCFNDIGTWGMVRTKPLPEPLDFLRGSPICHAPCLMRREAVLAVGGYGAQPWILGVEDLYLWFRLYAAGYRAMNLQEPLYRVRDDQKAQGRRTLARRVNETRVRWKGFRMLNLPRYQRIRALKPLLLWALPTWAYRSLHGWRLKTQ